MSTPTHTYMHTLCIHAHHMYTHAVANYLPYQDLPQSPPSIPYKGSSRLVGRSPPCLMLLFPGLPPTRTSYGTRTWLSAAAAARRRSLQQGVPPYVRQNRNLTWPHTHSKRGWRWDNFYVCICMYLSTIHYVFERELVYGTSTAGSGHNLEVNVLVSWRFTNTHNAHT